ncbi:MAG: recombinase family protein [Clostridiales bacterium]|jgi:DNA invertase Pin-like site-specific DNA recombinase|nr:recombinase family protein [Clostridiales bacterium]
MARKSRKTAAVEAITVPQAKLLFRAAVYARLSSEDREALSLENQLLMVRNYIEDSPELALCGEYSDNGLTGTNFHRPGFENLMEEVRRGKINCIVVKDLSRFGRDYVEAGNFLEVIFPRLGVRFISIGDNYDSFDPRCKSEGMSIALKNMINAFYAKDISQKIRSAFAVKSANGEFVGKVAPYGYMKSPESKNRLVVDNDAAEVVRMIYRWKLDGMGVYQIARRLTREGIPNPGHYRYIKGIHKEKRYEKPQAWDTSVIKDILENVVYLGHIAMGKTRTVAGRQIDVPREEWKITENTHPPIVRRADFNAVSDMLREVREKQDALNRHAREELPEYLLDGLAFCADCGRAYRRIPNTHRDKVTYRLTYICSYCNANSPKYTYRHFPQDELYSALYTMLRNEIELCASIRERMAGIKASPVIKRHENERAAEIGRIQRRLDRIPVMKQKIYDDFCDGVIEETEYRHFNRQYDGEKEALAAQLTAIMAEAEKLEPGFIDGNPWVSVMERFMDEKELTREMLLAMVERIEITGDRRIEVTYRFADEYKRPLLHFIEESEAAPA